MTVQIAHLERKSTALACIVCHREPGTGVGWFLVVENSWFDRIRVLRWHPALAEAPEMNAVCCKQHLRTLLTHWLNYADLEFTGGEGYRLPVVIHCESVDRQGGNFLPALVGELSVYRETLSRAWNGSTQALESILGVLLDGVMDGIPMEAAAETAPDVPAFNLPVAVASIESGHFALQN